MAATNSRLAELAALIPANTIDLDKYYDVNGLPTPPMSKDASIGVPLPPDMLKSRDENLAASAELQALVARALGSSYSNTKSNINFFVSLQAIYRYKIAHAVRFEGELSFEEIARRCSMEVSDMRRLLRVATADYIFQEMKKGFISHSAIPKQLVQIPNAFQWMGYTCDELWPSEVRTVDAMMKWPGSAEPNQTGFALSDPSGEAFFDTLKHDVKRAQCLTDSIKFLQLSLAISPSILVEQLVRYALLLNELN